MHGPRKSSEECKVLNEYSKNYSAQRPHKDNEASSGGKTNRDKSVEFDIRVKEANIMDHDDPITKKRKGKTG